MPDYFRPATEEEIAKRGFITDLALQYRLTPQEYETTLTTQDSVCAICGKTDSDKRLSIDHDHSCCPAEKRACGACVRGFLCQKCNHGLGLFKDSIPNLLKAIEYLRYWQRNPRLARDPIVIPHGNKGKKHTPEAKQKMSQGHSTPEEIGRAKALGQSNVSTGLLARLRTSEHQFAAARAPRPKNTHKWQHLRKGVIDPNCEFCV